MPAQATPSPDFMNRFAVTAQGWREENDENISNDLTQLDLIVRRRSDCDKKYEKNLSPSIINYWFPNMTISSMFCASSNLKIEGTCYGQSGGPTIIK